MSCVHKSSFINAEKKYQELGTYIKMTRYIFWTEERFQISLVIELNSLQEIYRGNEIVEMRDIFDF